MTYCISPASSTLYFLHIDPAKLAKPVKYMEKAVKLPENNMYVKYIPSYSPLLYSKTGVYRVIHFFFLFLIQNID